MGLLRRRRTGRTRLASVVLCVTFLAAHPAVACTLWCLSQGHELAGHPGPMKGPMTHHEGPRTQLPPCHARQLTSPHFAVAMVLSPALPSAARVPLPAAGTVLAGRMPGVQVSRSHQPAVDLPPPRLG